MEIVTQKIDTKSRTVEYITDELIKVYEKRSLTTQENKINLSLDLTKPEYILTEAFGDGDDLHFYCEYYRMGKKIYTGDVYKKSMKKDITIMLDAVSDQIEKEAFEQKCYELYQLEWMMSHGYSLNDLYRVMLQYEQEMFDPDDFRDSEGNLSAKNEFSEDDLERAAMQARDIFLFEQGFGKSHIFAGKKEFLDAEYKDPSYMKWLFDSQVDEEADRLKSLYRKYTGTDIYTLHDLKVNTSAGVLRAYRTTDPGQPGIITMFQPAGYDVEIDCAFVSVYEDEAYATEGERLVDVSVMAYGDPYSEDYSYKAILKREDVTTALHDAYEAAKEESEDFEYRLTDTGEKTTEAYIAELAAKRKEILDAGLDTADSTYIPVREDIVDDVNSLGVDGDGEYFNGWPVTDNYDSDYPLLLKVGRDLEKVTV